ncbi:MAG: universal stress protein [Planctomycetales bacterium]|nr:universal stress protein [Planctomycetales bacterium]NIM08374.1 universal stress protein [Planctomycetales bacterium]NIN07850.1 universal stress protein [Planctomycetales bacterium]NIN76978.1 universal stress protein [Planctomycetales bacterium]NIO34162.1 universal stress protein [Planctomycetales bacterium]
MIQLRRILLPTDFSEHAGEALKYACAFSEQFSAELHLLHVLETHVSTAPQFGMGLALSTHIQESREAATKALEELLDPNWASGRNVVRATSEGPPFVGIIRYAREHEIDMIVLGTHGWSGLPHILMGSVAERVVRKAPCPVLTVRPEGHQFVMP